MKCYQVIIQLAVFMCVLCVKNVQICAANNPPQAKFVTPISGVSNAGEYIDITATYTDMDGKDELVEFGLWMYDKGLSNNHEGYYCLEVVISFLSGKYYVGGYNSSQAAYLSSHPDVIETNNLAFDLKNTTIDPTPDGKGYIIKWRIAFKYSNTQSFDIYAYTWDRKSIWGVDGVAGPKSWKLTGTDPIPPTGSVIINGGDQYTKSRKVTLSVNAYDNSGAGQIRGARISEDGVSWVLKCRPITSSNLYWTFSPGHAQMTIYVKFIDVAGNESQVYSDSVLADFDLTPPTGSITINGGDPYGTCIDVTLTFTAKDNPGGSGVGSMGLSNDGAYYSIGPYCETKKYRLPSGNGKKTVYVKFMDAEMNESVAYSSSITLNIAENIPPSGSITINNNDFTTINKSVTLSLPASDDCNGSGIYKMRLSNDGVTYTPPENYSLSKQWDLTGAMGERAVYVMYGDYAGNWSQAYSDKIYLYVPVQLGEVIPNNGTSKENEFVTISATYKHPDGKEYINDCSLIVNMTPKDGGHGLSVSYTAPNNYLWFYNSEDPKLHWYGARAGYDKIYSNSYASIDLKNTTVVPTADGKGITVNWRVSFTYLFPKNANIYVSANASFNTTIPQGANAFEQKGTWSIVYNDVARPTNLYAKAVTATQTDLTWMDNSTNEVGFEIERATAEAGPWSHLSVTPADTTCYSDRNLPKGNYYYRVRAYTWASYSEFSNIAGIVANTPPQLGVVEVKPGHSKADEYGTISAAYSDPDGKNDIKLCLMIINTAPTGEHCIYAVYSPSADMIYLANDAGTGYIASAMPGANTVLANSYGTIDCKMTSVIPSSDGKGLTIAYRVSFTDNFPKSANVYTAMGDLSGSVIGYQKKDVWTIDSDTVLPTGMVSINNNEIISVKRKVRLALTAHDNANSGRIAKMRLSKDGVYWSQWQDFTASVDMALPAGSGTKTVYAKFKDADDNVSAVVSDSVMLCDMPKMVMADIDGTGKDDLVIDIGQEVAGTPPGVWIIYGDGRAENINSLSCEGILAGDMNNDGKDDLIIDFGTQYGIYVKYTGGTFRQLTSLNPETMVLGNFDNKGGIDVIGDFGDAYGLWIIYDDMTYAQVCPVSPENMIADNFVPGGTDEIMLDYGNYAPAPGTYLYMNPSSSYYLLFGGEYDTEYMIAADVKGDSCKECVIDFGPETDPGHMRGLWVGTYTGGGAGFGWEQIAKISPEIMAAGKLDDNAKEDLMIDFGNVPDFLLPNKVWIRSDGGSYSPVTGMDVYSISMGDIDNNGRSDAAMDLGPGNGIWIRKDNGAYLQKCHKNGNI